MCPPFIESSGIYVIIHQVLVMGLLIALGVVCYKLKIINAEVTKALSSMVLLVINPMVILTSYQTPFEAELLKGLVGSFLLAGICYALSMLLAGILIRKKPGKSNHGIERFSCIYSNCGFMGIPLVNAVYGAEGVFYLTAFITLFNVLVWTHGVLLMNGKSSLKMVLDALRSPAILATLIGFILFMLGIRIPEVPLDAIGYIGSMNTPMAMIVAGATIAQTNVPAALKKGRIYYIAFIKLLAIPVLIIVLFRFFPFSDTLIGTNVLAVACPAAATGVLFSLKYDRDSVYASEIFAMTTLMSMVTLPLIMFLNQAF